MPEPTALRHRGPKDTGSRFIPKVLVDITDLRAIEAEMSAIGPVEVTSDEFAGKAKSIDEFVALGRKSLETVKFYAHASEGGGWRSVSLSEDRSGKVHIHTMNIDDHLIAGVMVRLEQICRARSRKFVALAYPLSLSFGLGGFLCLMVSGVLAVQRNPPAGAVYSLLWWVIALLTVAMVLNVVGTTVRGGIMLVSREERPGWLPRNRDNLLVEIVGGLVVLGVGFLIGQKVK